MDQCEIHRRFNYRSQRAGLAILILTFISTPAWSQTLSGRIISENDSLPIAYASIGIKGKKAGVVADMSGRFSIQIPGFVRKNDTIIISAVGYDNIRLPLISALDKSEFRLRQMPKNMDPVTLTSFLNEGSGGTRTDKLTHYRGWYEVRTGGEIGRNFQVFHDEYKLERIRFKIDNQCDTCLIRLHVRKFANDLPGEELLTENILLTVPKLSADRIAEFDLSDADIILKEKNFYIGFEVLKCSSGDSTAINSICFVGTENGDYVYRSHANSLWQFGDQYNIYIRYYIKY